LTRRMPGISKVPWVASHCRWHVSLWVSFELLCTGPWVTATGCSQASWKMGIEASWGLSQRTSICTKFDVQCHDWHCSYTHLGHRRQEEL
jgi:hypothetical protein